MPFRQYIRKRDQQGEYWQGQDFAEHLSLCELQLTTDLLLEHLPENGLVLEAGCGLARWALLFLFPLTSIGQWVVPPHATVEGRTIPEWWKWALALRARCL